MEAKSYKVRLMPRDLQVQPYAYYFLHNKCIGAAPLAISYLEVTLSIQHTRNIFSLSLSAVWKEAKLESFPPFPLAVA